MEHGCGGRGAAASPGHGERERVARLRPLGDHHLQRARPSRAGGRRCQAGPPDKHAHAAKAPERVRLPRHGACTAPTAGRAPSPYYPLSLLPPHLHRGATFMRCPACVVSVMMSPGCASVGTTTW